MGKKIKKFIIRVGAMVLTCGIEIYRKFRPAPEGIYFCYNQSVHQIYHSIFIAIELSNLQSKYPVIILSTSKEASDIIQAELDAIPNKVKFIRIFHPGYKKVDFSVNWFVFLCRLRMHRPKAVVVTDYYDNVFRQLRLETFWVFVNHGVMNREFSFEPHIREYDLVIFPGESDRNELEKRIGRITNGEVLGYSKLDYLRHHALTPANFFDGKKPVLLYNPHFEKELSSFFTKGIELLEALAETGKYNILFMPHPDLSRRYPGLIRQAEKIPGIIVIARHRINLEYMAGADVYITDVSSSVFEWLYFDKPVIFFNSKKIDWEKSRYYPSWVLGSVVEDIPQMRDAVEYALKHPEEFQEVRRKVFEHTFLNRDKNASKQIAEIIWRRIE